MRRTWRRNSLLWRQGWGLRRSRKQLQNQRRKPSSFACSASAPHSSKQSPGAAGVCCKAVRIHGPPSPASRACKRVLRAAHASPSSTPPRAPSESDSGYDGRRDDGREVTKTKSACFGKADAATVPYCLGDVAFAVVHCGTAAGSAPAAGGGGGRAGGLRLWPRSLQSPWIQQ